MLIGKFPLSVRPQRDTEKTCVKCCLLGTVAIHIAMVKDKGSTEEIRVSKYQKGWMKNKHAIQIDRQINLFKVGQNTSNSVPNLKKVIEKIIYRNENMVKKLIKSNTE